MSRVLLIAADKPLPLCNKQEERTRSVTIPDSVNSDIRGKTFTVTAVTGFKVDEHAYYRPAVEHLGYEIKPFQYELDLEEHENDLKHLLDYLRENFICGETVELWNLWLGVDQDDRPVRVAGALNDFDMDTLRQFLEPMLGSGVIAQCRMTISI